MDLSWDQGGFVVALILSAIAFLSLREGARMTIAVVLLILAWLTIVYCLRGAPLGFQLGLSVVAGAWIALAFLAISEHRESPASNGSPRVLRELSPEEMRSYISDLGHRMRVMESGFISAMNEQQENRFQATRHMKEGWKQVWANFDMEDTRMRDRHHSAYIERLLPEMQAVREDLLVRVGRSPDRKPNEPTAFWGLLAGPMPLGEAAAYLEQLGRQI